MYKYRNGCPNVLWLGQLGCILLGEQVEVGGPMGEFLYEVDEMEGNSRMGKLIMDEMEGQ
jgi:hypothetical protein